ncbi:MAG TPA: serine--tRNA ligase, partial [Candidatus Nanoarchaeia archaeon]|nr:serine--tRNA ligase [Candidatus Nanoarchaeia archaeon]
MIDINHLKENPEAYRDTIKKKNQKDKLPLVDEAVRLDTDIKALKASAQKLRADRNKVSEAINEAKKSGKDVKKVLEEAKEIPKKIEQIEAEQIKLEHELDGIIRAIPNIMHKDVPIGKDGTDNVETMKIGTVKNFKFPVKAHSELAEELGIADFDSARNVAGTGFYYLEGDLALLNQALIRFAIDKMVLKGFRYIETP